MHMKNHLWESAAPCYLSVCNLATFILVVEGEACRLVGATQDISQAELILIIIKNGFFEKGSFCAFNVVLLENAWFDSHQLARSQ